MTAPALPRPDAVAAPRGARDGWRDLSWRRVKIVARSDMRQLIEDKGFWMPMVFLGGIFFLLIPTPRARPTAIPIASAGATHRRPSRSASASRRTFWASR